MSFSGPSTKKRGPAPRDQTSSPTYVLGESAGEKVVDAVTVEHVDHENQRHLTEATRSCSRCSTLSGNSEPQSHALPCEYRNFMCQGYTQAFGSTAVTTASKLRPRDCSPSTVSFCTKIAAEGWQRSSSHGLGASRTEM